MRTFKTLTEVAAYITDGEDASKYRWNNDAGDWDIEDIQCNAQMYDEQYSEYAVDVETYDIYDGEFKGGECLFRRIDDAK
ncbi:MAG: hypothetical protein K1W23_21525 [Lachnospiraceae bacterium]